MEVSTLMILACVFGLFMAWGVGANDVANALGTSVGSKAITLKQAVIIAAIFEFAGAYLAGGQVTATIRKGMLDLSMITAVPELVVYGMIASLLAAGIWLLIASRLGWPVSTTHTIVGAIVGFAAVGIGFDVVNWGKIGQIVISWIVTPVIAGGISFALFISVQKLILDSKNPFIYAQRYVPYYMFLVGFILSLVTLLKGLKHVGLELNVTQVYILAAFIGLIIMIGGKKVISKIKIDPQADREFQFSSVEKVFAAMVVVTACAMAFAHGSNDVANAVGPLAAAVSILQSGELTQTSQMPAWILLLGAIGIVVGLITYGHKVMATIGAGITALTPSRAFCAEMGAATTVVIASGTGIPISTTQTLVGAVLGVGFARGIGALNLKVVRMILTSWVITLPAGAIMSIVFFYILKSIFS